MWSITLKLMKKSGKMLIPAGIAILIGTAFIASTFLFGNAMERSLTDQLTASFGKANYVMGLDSDTQDAQMSGDSSVASPTVGELHLDQMRSVNGVKAAEASVSAPFSITGDHTTMTYAVATSPDATLLPVDIAQGTQPSKDNEIALPDSLASELKASVGSTISLNTQSNSSNVMTAPTSAKLPAKLTLHVVGLTHDTQSAYASYGGASVLSKNVFALMNGVKDYSQVSVSSSTVLFHIDEQAADTAVPALRKMMPQHYQLDTRQKIGDDQMKALSSGGTQIITTFLLVFGILAMFVAALVIANTFQVMVAQRRRTLALLRAIGAQKGQLYRSVLTEAGLLGVISSLLGIGAGIGLMALMAKTNILNGDGAPVHVVITPAVIWVPLLFGVIITVLASLSSARSATNVTPLEALRPYEAMETKTAGRVRGIAGTLMVALGALLCYLGAHSMTTLLKSDDANSGNGYDTSLLQAIGGCALIFLGLVITATFWLPVLMRGIGAVVSHIGPSANIANSNIQKNPKRVAATGVALLIGVTLVSTIATGAASGKATVDSTLDEHYSVDMTASGSGLNKATADKLSAVQGVKDTLYAPTAVASIKGTDGDEKSVTVIGVDSMQSLHKVLHAKLDGMTLDSNAVLLSKVDGVSGKELDFGNRVTLLQQNGGNQPDQQGQEATSQPEERKLTLNTQQVDFRKVGEESFTGFVDISHFTNGDLNTDGHILLGSVASGSQNMKVFTRLQEQAANFEGVTLTGPAAARQQWDQAIDQIMAVLVGLLAVAVLIALIGVANTLSLSVIERTRESATLRALGMTRGQLKRSLAVEALLIAVVNGILGIALGTGFGWLGSYMVFSFYGNVIYSFNWSYTIVLLVIAVVAALGASIFPARRAVKTPPVEALAEA